MNCFFKKNNFRLIILILKDTANSIINFCWVNQIEVEPEVIFF